MILESWPSLKSSDQLKSWQQPFYGSGSIPSRLCHSDPKGGIVFVDILWNLSGFAATSLSGNYDGLI